jgi:hypothetical protein
MKGKEIIREAWRSQDHVKLGKIADWLRFKAGMDYLQTVDYVSKVIGKEISAAAWDEMMYLADMEHMP